MNVAADLPVSYVLGADLPAPAPPPTAPTPEVVPELLWLVPKELRFWRVKE